MLNLFICLRRNWVFLFYGSRRWMSNWNSMKPFFILILFWVNWTQIKAQFKELVSYSLGYLVIKHRKFWATYSMWENTIYGINCNIVKYILKIWIPQYYPYPIESEQVINLSSPLPLLQRERKRKFYWLRSEHMNPKLID